MDSTSLLPHCRRCGEACCRYSTPILDRHERDRIVVATGKDYFLEVATHSGSYFVIGRKADGSLRKILPTEDVNGDPCTFLAPDGTCSIHAIKPLDCAAYPVRAVPLPNGGLSWHLHHSCPAHGSLSPSFFASARALAEASARRFPPPVFADWLRRFSRWTLDPEAAFQESGTIARRLKMSNHTPSEMDPNLLMEATVRRLAAAAPQFCDRSGMGFWPVPAIFPRLLSECLRRLQEEITDLYLAGSREQGELLARSRVNLLRLVAEGDLGEDHTALFLTDHPAVLDLPEGKYQELPFHAFCQGVLGIDDPIVLLGVLMRNEAGSVGEMKALLAVGMVAPGRYSEVHLVEEVTHARLAAEVEQLLCGEVVWRDRFRVGQRLHDEFYMAVAG